VNAEEEAEATVAPPDPARPRPGFLYLPIEIAARELDSKLFIAHFAVKLGLEVVLGQKWLMQDNIADMPAGFWIFKTLTPGDSRYMEEARALGNQIGAIDEEMPGLGENAGGLRWVSRKALDACDLVFCLGEIHRGALLTRYPEHQTKYRVVGNPRWDLLRPELRSFYEPEASALRREYGKFILINTNIGLMNSAKNTPDEVVKTLERHGKVNLSLPEDRAFVENLRLFESSNLAGCLDLLPLIADAFPDYRIVLRPHPTERIETYHEVMAKMPRAVLATSSTAAPWILAAEALVHTSCTTGTEAFALGKPSITYQTVDSPLLANYLSNRLNFIAHSAEEVLELLRRQLGRGTAGPDYPDEMTQTFRRFFAAQEGDFSSKRIAEACANRLGARRDATLNTGRARWSPGLGYRYARRSTPYQAQLFPDLNAGAIEQRLAIIASILGEDRPAVAKCGEGQFHLYDARLAPPSQVRRLPNWLPRWFRGVARVAASTFA